MSVAAVLRQQSGPRNVSYCHPSTPDVRAIAAAHGTQTAQKYSIATAADHMSYETAQKVQQQQLKDRVAYAAIILLGFVALYINIKRAANEQAAWEKDHS